MKTTFFLIFYTICFAQFAKAQSLVGLWEGILYNDSTGLNYVYDLAITENQGKLSGYSRTGFIYKDEQFFSMKEISVKLLNGKILTKDEGTISQYYPTTPPKGVFQLNILNMTVVAGDTILAGEFSTNRTKKYTQVTGLVKLVKKAGPEKSSMLPHLQELGLVDDLSFLSKDIFIKEDPVIVIKAKREKKKELPKTERKLVVQQTVNFAEDSLSISLYDNGEVDGDTVSVFVNGKLLLAKQGLSTKPIKFMISTKELGESFTLSMFAETIGEIPPNTGLMIVYDGKKRTEVRFSGSFVETAAVIFNRQKTN